MTTPGWYARGPQGISVVDAALDGSDLVFGRDQEQPPLRVPVPSLADAADAAAAAAGSASAAAGSATAAAGSASTAAGHAVDASASAAAASGSASAAASSASESSGFADAAAGSAVSASSSASAAAQAVADAIEALIGSAPETLDTLAELATALGNDPNFATTVATLIGQKVSSVETPSRVYGTTSTGGPTTYPVSATGVSADSVVLRGEGGRFSAGAPTDASHVTNKTYVDNGLSGKANTAHTHNASDLNAGTVDPDRLPFWKGTQAQYDALGSYLPGWIYFIEEQD